nr:pleiotropic drug resistance protein 1-like [Ipomoea batatas]GMD27672.1 pleiotropic drug resistance protein 1-like [Ipomoea batatas]GMD55708.1 pleiotropic drug resistance protein 1-like [Ipomoea batatas]
MKAREINARVNMLEVITLNMLEGFLNSIHILPNRKKSLPILHEVIGIIKPGRMTLLLGPSSSGKTALLLALAGKLGSDQKAHIKKQMRILRMK